MDAAGALAATKRAPPIGGRAVVLNAGPAAMGIRRQVTPAAARQAGSASPTAAIPTTGVMSATTTHKVR